MENHLLTTNFRGKRITNVNKEENIIEWVTFY
nr:MAG TPA: hypothetical protein [Caudoviricetes sp.]